MNTALDLIQHAFETACAYNQASESAPEALLWCDPAGEFQDIVALLRPRVPHLLTLGTYEPANRVGPAIWLRAAIAGVIDEIQMSPGCIPVVYVPQVGRETFRSAEDCPSELQPLVWLSVAGCFFGHVNGKDWTLRAMLGAERGPIKLRVGEDAATRTALTFAASKLVTSPLVRVREKHWDAAALYQLITPDPVADALDWLNGTLSKQDDQRFSAFAEQASRNLGFSPKKLTREQGGAISSCPEATLGLIFGTALAPILNYTRAYDLFSTRRIRRISSRQKPSRNSRALIGAKRTRSGLPSQL